MSVVAGLTVLTGYRRQLKARFIPRSGVTNAISGAHLVTAVGARPVKRPAVEARRQHTLVEGNMRRGAPPDIRLCGKAWAQKPRESSPPTEQSNAILTPLIAPLWPRDLGPKDGDEVVGNSRLWWRREHNLSFVIGNCSFLHHPWLSRCVFANMPGTQRELSSTCNGCDTFVVTTNGICVCVGIAKQPPARD